MSSSRFVGNYRTGWINVHTFIPCIHLWKRYMYVMYVLYGWCIKIELKQKKVEKWNKKAKTLENIENHILHQSFLLYRLFTEEGYKYMYTYVYTFLFLFIFFFALLTRLPFELFLQFPAYSQSQSYSHSMHDWMDSSACMCMWVSVCLFQWLNRKIEK